ncbi:MAG: DUF5683 domain-containing protein [bacterium]
MKLFVLVVILLLVNNLSVLCAGKEVPKYSRFRNEISNQDTTRFEVTKKKKKSPKGAVLRSLAFPGWGQWYNEQKIKSLLVFSTESFLIGLSFYYNNKATNSDSGSVSKEFYTDKRNLMYWLIGGFTLLSMLDAYIDAHLYDFDTGPDLALRIGAISEAGGTRKKYPVLGLSFTMKF